MFSGIEEKLQNSLLSGLVLYILHIFLEKLSQLYENTGYKGFGFIG